MKNMTCLTIGRFVFYLFLLLSFFSAGCTVVGRTVPVDNRILFAGQNSTQGNYKYGDLSVQYSYELRGGEMNLNGSVRHRGGFDSLDVRVQLIDTEGAVLSQKIVYSSGYRSSRSRDRDLSFRTMLDVPPGAAGISFSYSARSRSSHQ